MGKSKKDMFHKRNLAKELSDNLLLTLSTAKTKDLPNLFNLLDNLIISALPKKSKTLSRNFIKTIFSVNEDRLLILLSHLYLEKCIEEIIINKFKRPKKILTNSFKKKVDIIYSLGELDENIYHKIILINRIRNKYVHNLDYHYKIENFVEFSDIKKVLDFIQNKHIQSRPLILRYLLKIELFIVVLDLYGKHRFLYLTDASTPE